MGTPTYRGVSNAAGQSNGTTGTGTVPVTPTLPSGTVAGDRVFIFQMATSVGTIWPSVPTGWTGGYKQTIGDTSSPSEFVGTGTQAAGSGERRLTWIWRDYDGVWSMPAMDVVSGAARSNWVVAVAVTPTAGNAFVSPSSYVIHAKSAYNAASTAYTWNNGSQTTITGARLLIASCFNDNVTSSGGGLTQTGATFAGYAEIADGGTATGNDVSGKVHTCTVTTGATATLTHTQTLSAASQGESIVIQLVERPTVAFHTLNDDFSAGTVDTGKWTISSGTWTQSGGALNVTGGGNLQTVSNYSLMGSYIDAQFMSTGQNAYLILDATSPDPSNSPFYWQISSGGVAQPVHENVAGSTVSHIANRSYRIRESSGNIYYDYSDDRVTWTNLQTSVRESSATNLNLRLNTGGPYSFDNVNVGPSFNLLADDFSTGSTPDATKWVTTGTATVGSGVCTFGTSGAIRSIGKFDLVGSEVFTQTVTSAAGQVPLQVIGSDNATGVAWFFDTSTRIYANGPSVNTFATAVTHTNGNWYRVREASGTVYWDYSTDGISWTNHTSAAIANTPFRQATLRAAGIGLVIDNVNVPPPTAGILAATALKSIMSVAGTSVDASADGTLTATALKSTASLAGAQAQTGTLTASALKSTAALSGIQQYAGTLTATALKALAGLTGTHVENPTGTLAALALKATASFTAAQEYIGNLTANAPKSVAALNGTSIDNPTGSLTALALKAVAALTGTQEQSGTLTASALRATASLTGEQPTSGILSAAALKAMAALNATQEYAGTLTASALRATASFTGVMEPSGILSAAALKAAATLNATQEQAGALVASALKAVASFTGTMEPSGILGATALKATASFSAAQEFTGTLTASALKSIASMTAVNTNDILGNIVAFALKATASMTGEQPASGALSATAPKSTAALTGVMEPSGILAATALKASAALTAVQEYTSVFAGSALKATASLNAIQEYVGILAMSAKNAAANLVGTQEQSGILSAANVKAIMASAGTALQTGALTMTALKSTAAFTASQEYLGTLTASARKAIASFNAAQSQSGILGASARKAVASLTATLTNSGVLHAVARKAVAALTGASTVDTSVPRFLVVGKLKQIGIGMAESVLRSAIVTFKPNIPATVLARYLGKMLRVRPVVAHLDANGDIVNADGEPVRLLAEHGSLNLEGLQWQVSVRVPASVIPPAPEQKFRSWWIDAGFNGDTIDVIDAVPDDEVRDAHYR